MGDADDKENYHKSSKKYYVIEQVIIGITLVSIYVYFWFATDTWQEIADEEDMTDDELLRTYLEMCKYHPVTFGEGSAANPEELKVSAMRQFMEYVKTLSQRLQEKAYMKNKISNYFTPYIGFSDDDVRNVDTMKKHFKDKDEDILHTYLTAGGIKRKY